MITIEKTVKIIIDGDSFLALKEVCELARILLEERKVRYCIPESQISKEIEARTLAKKPKIRVLRTKIRFTEEEKLELRQLFKEHKQRLSGSKHLASK